MPDSSLAQVDHDAKLANDIVFRVLATEKAGGIIEFQFAPKISAETNSSSWMEIDVWSYEMLRIHKGSSGKRINMEWEYIATDDKFTPEFIASQLRLLKSYFFDFTNKIYPIVAVRYTEVIPIETHFRLRDVNISYGPELIRYKGKSYPLYVKPIVTLELATSGKVGQAGAGAAAAAGSVGPEKGFKKIVMTPLKDVVPQWY